MNADTISALIIAGIAVAGAIGSVLLLAFRVGRIVGTTESFMATSERRYSDLRADLTRQTDRLSLHIEHHGQVTP